MTQPTSNGTEAKFARLETSISSFVEEQKRFNSQVLESVEKIAKAQSESARPQYFLLIGLVGIIMSIGQATLAPVKAQVESNRVELSSSEARLVKAQEKLDERLQREFNLINDKTDNKVKDLDRVSADRHADAVTRLSESKSFQDRQVERDLDELRQRRLKGGT